jgi:predicted transcriptional regulator
VSDGRVKVHVGESLDEIGARAIDAWHRMERGEEVNERYIGFETLETMVRVLSPKRVELLRHLHRHPAPHIRALASALGRDYRRVHEDVEALKDAGLLERDKDGLRADYDAFDVRMRMAL